VQKDKAIANQRLETLEDIRKSFQGILENTQVLVKREHADKAKPADMGPPALTDPVKSPNGSVPPAIEVPKLSVGTNEFARMNDNLRRAEVEWTAAVAKLKQLEARLARLDTAEVSSEDLENALKKDQDYKDLVARAEKAERKVKYYEQIMIDPAN